MLRVVQFIDGLGCGGKERQLVELLKGFSSSGLVESHVITMSDECHYDLTGINVNIYVLLRRCKKDFGIFPRLFKLLREIKPSILHSWSSMCSFYALPIVKALDIRFVNGFLRSAPPNLGLRHKDYLIGRLTFPFSDVVVSNSMAALEVYRVPYRKACCIYNGFDFRRIENLASSEEVRRKFSLGQGPVVGMVASFSDKKDYKVFVEAGILILSKGRDVTFVAVGDGKNLPDIRAMVPKEFKERFLFLGRQSNVESIINVMDVGVLASNPDIHGEGISNTIMEYMALSKPVVATESGGNSEIVVDGKTGFIVPPRAPEALAKAILRFIDDKELAKSFGKAGRRRLETDFSLERMIDDYIRLYRAVAEGRKKPCMS